MKASITEALIRKEATRLKREGKHDELDIYDTGQPGLVVRIRRSGKHSYKVSLGRARWLTLGRTDVLKPAEARQLAVQRLGEQAHGLDPIAEKRKGRTSTLGAFLDEQWKNANGSPETAARVKQAFPDFVEMRLGEIESFGIERWRKARHKAGVTKATTNRDLDALRAVLSRAVTWGALKANPVKSVKRERLDVRGRARY